MNELCVYQNARCNDYIYICVCVCVCVYIYIYILVFGDGCLSLDVNLYSYMILIFIEENIEINKNKFTGIPSSLALMHLKKNEFVRCLVYITPCITY